MHACHLLHSSVEVEEELYAVELQERQVVVLRPRPAIFLCGAAADVLRRAGQVQRWGGVRRQPHTDRQEGS